MTQHAQQSVAAADLPERGQPLAGGTFVTRYWLNGEERALVLLDNELIGTWGKYGEDVAGAKSLSDGAANTRAMAEAGSEIAIKALELGAHIPSCLEGSLMMAAKADGVIQSLKEDWYWLSSQRSANIAFFMYFGGGGQYLNAKHHELRVRPVRSLLIR
ncbi:hypothetical protein [Pseudomonas chlororaphis]